MSTAQFVSPLRSPRADVLYDTIATWIDRSVREAKLTPEQRARAKPLLQRWMKRVTLEVDAIVDERGLLDLLSQLDQLIAKSGGHIDDGTPLVSTLPPEQQLRDQLMLAYEEEKGRLEAVSAALREDNERLQSAVADKQDDYDKLQLRAEATVALFKDAASAAQIEAGE